MVHWVNQRLDVVADSDNKDSLTQLQELKQLLKIPTKPDLEWEFDFNNIIPMPEAIKNTPAAADEVLSEQMLSSAVLEMTVRDFMANGPIELLGHLDFKSLDNYSRFDESLLMSDFINDIINNIVGVQSKFLRGYYRERANNPLSKENANPSIIILRIRELVDKALTREENLIKYGYPNAYEWAYAHWGTKLNARGSSLEEDDEHSISIYFEAAWQPPEIIYDALAQRFPELNFMVHFVDETGLFAGSISYVSGTIDDYWTTDDSQEITNIALSEFDINYEELYQSPDPVHVTS